MDNPGSPTLELQRRGKGKVLPVKVLILTQGSRGDIQPFVALSCGLKTAGHDVILAGPNTLAQVAQPYNIQYVPIYDITINGFSDPTASKAIKSSGNGTLRYLIQQGRSNRNFIRYALDDIARIDYRGCDIVVHNHMCPGHEIAERLKVPSVAVGVFPFMVPTSSFANPWIPFKVPRILNRATYLAAKPIISFYIGNTSKWRENKVGLPPRRGHRNMFRLPDGRHATVLQPFSRCILPRDTDYPDWSHTVGYWFLPASDNWQPSGELVHFIDSGEPPVYIGFGSLSRVDKDPNRTARVTADAARLAGVRAIVFTGNQTSKHDGDIFHLTEQVPFGWLFPRMSAVVHHGGSGTIGAALAAGRPQVVCPAVYEQPFNAERMHAIGVAPAPIPLHQMSAQSLSQAIREASTHRPMAARAEELGHLIRNEDGVTAAVKILESLVA